MRDSILQVCCVEGGVGGRGGDLARKKTKVGEALLVGQASLGGDLRGGFGGQVSPLGTPGCLCDPAVTLLESFLGPEGTHPSLSLGENPWLYGVLASILFWIAGGLGKFSRFSPEGPHPDSSWPFLSVAGDFLN